MQRKRKQNEGFSFLCALIIILNINENQHCPDLCLQMSTTGSFHFTVVLLHMDDNNANTTQLSYLFVHPLFNVNKIELI